MIKKLLKNTLPVFLCIGVPNLALANNVSNNDTSTTNSNTAVSNITTTTTTTTNITPHAAPTISKQNSDMAPTNTDEDNFHHFFINGGIGGGVANSSDGSSYEGGFSGMVNVGYNFNKTFAIEGGYTGTSSTPNDTVFSAVLGIPTLNYSLYDIAMRSTLHLGQYFSFYGKLGGAIENATWTTGSFFGQSYQPGPNTTSLGALLGGGASVDLGPIGIFLEFDQYLAITGQNSATPANLSLLNLGLQYNF